MDAIRVFRRAAAREPDRIFAFDSTAAITYADADARSDAIASELISRGIAYGEPLGLCAPDSIALLLAILGTWKAGGVPALIDARTSDADLPYFVGDIGASLVAAAPELRDQLRSAGAKVVVDISSLGDVGGTVPNLHGPRSPLYLSYTSGTTGRPKGALLISEPVTLGTACIADRLSLTRQDVLLVVTTTSSSFQLVTAMLPAMHAFAAVGLAAGSTLERIWTLVHRWRVTTLIAYPLTLADILNAPNAGGGSSLRLAISGGAPLASRIKRDYRERLAIPLVESYGQSEFGGFMALGSPADRASVLSDFVGRSLPDRLAYVAGPDGEELPAGKIGEVVASHGFFAGYWNEAEATAKTLAGGVLHTGDLGVANADGYFKLVGRTREAETAKRRGGFLRELEDVYYEYPDVLHAAVVESGRGDIEAFVELRSGGSVEADDLSTFASARVVENLRPRRTTILAKMPRTFSGKVDRRRLSQVCQT